MIDTELQYFNENLPEWLKSQSGKFALIKNRELIGFYNTFEEALTEGARRFGLQDFLVRAVLPFQDKISIPAYTLGLIHANPSHTIHI
jgi:hypothetical protein